MQNSCQQAASKSQATKTANVTSEIDQKVKEILHFDDNTRMQFAGSEKSWAEMVEMLGGTSSLGIWLKSIALDLGCTVL